MATPSTTPRRSTFISDPVESPFPYTASPSPLTKSLTSPQQHHDHNTNEPPPFSPTQTREITTIFQLFNPTLSGYLDVETFEVMMLSLGYRVTSRDIVEIMQDISSSCSSDDPETTEAINNHHIDLSLAMQILARQGYATKERKSEDEMRIYFRLFDVSDKGYITVEDLKRVQQEAVQLEREMMLTNSDSSSSCGTVTDEFVQAIVQKFDMNSTGVIDFEEFAQIVHPIILS